MKQKALIHAPSHIFLINIKCITYFSSSALVSLVLSEPHIRPPDHFGSQGSQKHPLNAEFKN